IIRKASYAGSLVRLPFPAARLFLVLATRGEQFFSACQISPQHFHLMRRIECRYDSNCVAENSDGFFNSRRTDLALTELRECDGQITVSRGPAQRDPVSRPFLQSFTIDNDGFFQLRGLTLAFAEGGKRIAQVVLRCGPLKGHLLAGVYSQRI